jgi:hypothetical protein
MDLRRKPLEENLIGYLPDDVIGLIIKEYRAQLRSRIQKRLKKEMHVSLLRVMEPMKFLVDRVKFDSAALLHDNYGVQSLGVIDIINGMVDTRFNQPKSVWLDYIRSY